MFKIADLKEILSSEFSVWVSLGTVSFDNCVCVCHTFFFNVVLTIILLTIIHLKYVPALIIRYSPFPKFLLLLVCLLVFLSSVKFVFFVICGPLSLSISLVVS